MRAIKVGNVNVFPFRDMQELMDYTANDKKLLLSLNAEIIMKAEGEVADIIEDFIRSISRLIFLQVLSTHMDMRMVMEL